MITIEDAVFSTDIKLGKSIPSKRVRIWKVKTHFETSIIKAYFAGTWVPNDGSGLIYVFVSVDADNIEREFLVFPNGMYTVTPFFMSTLRDKETTGYEIEF